MKSISFHKSLGTRLLRIAFGLYMVVTLIITAYHLVSEYFHAERSVLSGLKNLVATFEDGIATSLWNFDVEQLNSILIGAVKIEQISFIRVENDVSETVAFSGLKIEEDMIAQATEKKELEAKILTLKNDWKTTYTEREKARTKENDSEEKLKEPLNLDEFSSEFYLYKLPIKIKEESDDEYKIAGTIFVYTDRKHVFARVEHGFSLIVINAVIKTLALWIIFLLTSRILVTNPLKVFSGFIHKLDPNNPAIELEKDDQIAKLSERHDEIGLLASVFRELVHATITNIKTIHSLNEGLEQKVMTRTNELAIKTQDIQNMLQNIKQGILTFGEDFSIHPEYSKFLEEIFETEQIENQNVIKFLFQKSHVSNHDIDQTKTALVTMFDEKEVVFIINGHHLIDEFILKIGEKEKILHLYWQPLTNSAGVITNIMLVIRDVTTEKSLEKAAQENREKMRIISEIIRNSPSSFLNFYRNSKDSLSEAKKAILEPKRDREINRHVYRILHTLKGESRTYHYKLISDILHDAEKIHSDFIEKKQTRINKEAIFSNINKIENELDKYYLIYKENLKDNFKDREYYSEKIGNCFTLANKIAKSPEVSENASPDMQALIYSLVDVSAFSIESLLEPILGGINRTARHIGKNCPKIEIQNDDFVKFPFLTKDVLKEVFIHLLRNTVDHGIEMPKVREDVGKSKVPHIHFKLLQEEQFIVVEYWDDGAGLALSRLAEKAKEIDYQESLDTDEQLAQLIFYPGISSKKTTNDISGRGMGMDIVKQKIEALGGTIDVQFIDERSENNFRSFKLVVKIPDNAFGENRAA